MKKSGDWSIFSEAEIPLLENNFLSPWPHRISSTWSRIRLSKVADQEQDLRVRDSAGALKSVALQDSQENPKVLKL